MKRSKLANVGKGRRIKRDRSGAVMMSMDDISVSLRTLVRNRYLTQTEADGLWLALGPTSDQQAIKKVMQTVTPKSSSFMQFLQNSTTGADSPNGSTETQASTGSSVGGGIGAVGGAAIGGYLGGVPGAILGAAVGKAVGEAVGAAVEDAMEGDGEDSGDHDGGGDEGGGEDGGGDTGGG